MKKVIGVPGYKDAKSNSSFGVGLTHLHFISQFGNPRIIMPWEEFVEVDMLYLPGGLDLSPLNYGEIPGYYTSNQDVFKEFFFNRRLDAYIEAKIPVVGICLGMQMLAVKFGSKIHQHLLFHPQSPDRREAGHDVWLADNPKKKFKVNSHHHQCVRLSQLGEDLVPLLFSKTADFTEPIVEAFEHKELPILGLQMHPEEWYDAFSVNKILNLLNNKK